MDRPNPLPATPAADAQAVRRKVFCDHYDRCLDTAVENRWGGFSCAGCQAYRNGRWLDTDWQADARRCHLLRLAVENPQRYHQLKDEEPVAAPASS
jgi:hypothetical protein